MLYEFRASCRQMTAIWGLLSARSQYNNIGLISKQSYCKNGGKKGTNVSQARKKHYVNTKEVNPSLNPRRKTGSQIICLRVRKKLRIWLEVYCLSLSSLSIYQLWYLCFAIGRSSMYVWFLSAFVKATYLAVSYLWVGAISMVLNIELSG